MTYELFYKELTVLFIVCKIYILKNTLEKISTVKDRGKIWRHVKYTPIYFQVQKIFKLKGGGWVKNSMLIWIDLCLSTILCKKLCVYKIARWRYTPTHFTVTKRSGVLKLEWSYLPFACETSFRNGGLLLNTNIFS